MDKHKPKTAGRVGLHRKQTEMNNSIRTSNALPRPAWRRLHWLNTALLAFALATPLLAESPQDQDEDKKGNDKNGDEHCRPHIVRPDSRPFGHTYPEWAAKWWQWVLTIPADSHHPLLDETGADAARGQSGPVWFLGGVINVSGTAVRYVTVPSGKALFFPVANVECSTLEPPPFYGANEAELRACAEGFPAGTMACTIDGRPVRNLQAFESTSPLFDFTLPANNILGVAGGGSGQAVDHGFYLMVTDLCPGEHTIAFKAASADGSFTLDVTYHLTVEPAAHVFPPQSHPYGKTYGAWGAEWWKWALSIPANQNPITDPTGEFGSLNQRGPVWFLAGTYGTTAERTIAIPEGKGIFFPIFNYFNDYPCPDSTFHPAPGQTLEAFLAQGAADFVDHATALAVEVDGAEVVDPFKYRAASRLVTFMADPSQITLDPCITPDQPQVGVADGYWVMLPPLPRGEHTIHILATVDAWGFRLDVTYHVTVTPRHR